MGVRMSKNELTLKDAIIHIKDQIKEAREEGRGDFKIDKIEIEIFGEFSKKSRAEGEICFNVINIINADCGGGRESIYRNRHLIKLVLKPFSRSEVVGD